MQETNFRRDRYNHERGKRDFLVQGERENIRGGEGGLTRSSHRKMEGFITPIRFETEEEGGTFLFVFRVVLLFGGGGADCLGKHAGGNKGH